MRTVRRRVACHLVQLHDALVALALGHADHVDDVTCLENLSRREHVADLAIRDLGGLVQANLAQNRGRLLQARLLDEPRLRSTDFACRRLFETELQGRVAMLLRRALSGHNARTDRKYGAAERGSVLVEIAGHPQLAANQAHFH